MRGTSVVFEQGLALVVDAMRFDAKASDGVGKPERIDDYLYWALIGRRDRPKSARLPVLSDGAG